MRRVIENQVELIRYFKGINFYPNLTNFSHNFIKMNTVLKATHYLSTHKRKVYGALESFKDRYITLLIIAWKISLENKFKKVPSII